MYNTIIKSNSSYGNWVIYLTPITSKYFWKKKDAQEFLKTLNK